MEHRLIPGNGNDLTPYEVRMMDHLIIAFGHSAFGHRDIRRMIKICRICPRVFDEPFVTERYHGICESAIVLAVAIQDMDMVEALAELLLEWGVDPTRVYEIDTGSYSSTLLIKAAEYGSFYIIRNFWHLICTDVNATDCDGYTALTMLFQNWTHPMSASHDQRLWILEILLRKGADVSMTDPLTGETPLFKACYQPTIRPVRLLLQNGANPFALNRFDRTPREDAVFNGVGDDNVCVAVLREVEDGIITSLRVRNETKKLALMMGFHKRLGEAAGISRLDPGMIHSLVVDEGMHDYTRLELSEMSKEEVMELVN
jgi:hypothetical protein